MESSQLVTAINKMVKKSSSQGSTPCVSPKKEEPTQGKLQVGQGFVDESTDTGNSSSPPSPGRLRRSLEVATQLYSSSTASLRERHPQVAAGVDAVSNRTKEALQQLVPENWNPPKFGAKVENLVGDLRIKSVAKKSWQVSTELVEKEVEPVVKHLELSVETFGSNTRRLASCFFSILRTLYKVSSQVADSFWQSPHHQTTSPSSSSAHGEQSWSSISSSVQDMPISRRFIGYMLQVTTLFMALLISCFRIVGYFLGNMKTETIYVFNRVSAQVKKTLNERFLFLAELFAFIHFMFGCFAVYIFELLKFYRGPGSSLVQYLPKLLPKSLQSYIVEDTDGQDTSLDADYSAEFAGGEREEELRPNSRPT